ncbi:MAG TPA: RdgB/HAM1 family non-canonical purine NTP pyrophosphatase [Polyangiales bacterium]
MAERERTSLLLATYNQGKVREFRELLADLPGLLLLTPADISGLPPVVEDGASFADNARKKARVIAQATHLLVLSDDSGLEVDALGGRPGVHSARYAGEHGDDDGNNEKLLSELASVPEPRRTARYRVVLALADLQGPLGEHVHTEDGVCEGSILRVRAGHGGFGYDPLFRLAGYDCTMAELSSDEKNRISHRALAMRKMKAFLASYLTTRR